jgi:hypothetical protein
MRANWHLMKIDAGIRLTNPEAPLPLLGGSKPSPLQYHVMMSQCERLKIELLPDVLVLSNLQVVVLIINDWSRDNPSVEILKMAEMYR